MRRLIRLARASYERSGELGVGARLWEGLKDRVPQKEGVPERPAR
jgi:hypothetical protein